MDEAIVSHITTEVAVINPGFGRISSQHVEVAQYFDAGNNSRISSEHLEIAQTFKTTVRLSYIWIEMVRSINSIPPNMIPKPRRKLILGISKEIE